MTRKVRTTMRPDEEIEVGDAEYTDLQRQGLLVEDDAHEDVPAETAAPASPGGVPAPTPGSAAKKPGPGAAAVTKEN
ncbi:hypothetical protein ACWERY_16275 [Streptomyces sp. NPDC004082]